MGKKLILLLLTVEIFLTTTPRDLGLLSLIMSWERVQISHPSLRNSGMCKEIPIGFQFMAREGLLIHDGLRIVKRRCTDCVDTHVNIFYKRLTPIPEDFDIMDLFLENWFEKEGNVFNVDFKLYTTLQDAKDDVDPWVYCNYNDDGVGFPRDCGPEKHVGGQWNSVNRGGRVDLLFSIEA